MIEPGERVLLLFKGKRSFHFHHVIATYDDYGRYRDIEYNSIYNKIFENQIIPNLINAPRDIKEENEYSRSPGIKIIKNDDSEFDPLKSFSLFFNKRKHFISVIPIKMSYYMKMKEYVFYESEHKLFYDLESSSYVSGEIYFKNIIRKEYFERIKISDSAPVNTRIGQYMKDNAVSDMIRHIGLEMFKQSYYIGIDGFDSSDFETIFTISNIIAHLFIPIFSTQTTQVSHTYLFRKHYEICNSVLDEDDDRSRSE